MNKKTAKRKKRDPYPSIFVMLTSSYFFKIIAVALFFTSVASFIRNIHLKKTDHLTHKQKKQLLAAQLKPTQNKQLGIEKSVKTKIKNTHGYTRYHRFWHGRKTLSLVTSKAK